MRSPSSWMIIGPSIGVHSTGGVSSQETAFRSSACCLCFEAAGDAARLLTAVGLGVATTGHVRDGNVAKSLETVRLHPLWNIRGDFAIARDMLARRA